MIRSMPQLPWNLTRSQPLNRTCSGMEILLMHPKVRHTRGMTTSLPATAAETTAHAPWPVRLLSQKMAEYISRMSPVWIEGQIIQLNANNASSLAFITLRDVSVDMSLSVTIPKRTLRAIAAPVEEGSHVIVHAKPELWTKRGSLSMNAREIRAVGVGELLARIEELKRMLHAEGLFAPERKRPLPFLPAKIGLICGARAKAQDDVVVNARARFPGVSFAIREVAVQGPNCVPQVTAALEELDADPEVEVIIITRGGGSVEDLLPFSNETLVRAAAAARTPIVSAIGHETDAPLLDLVADYRASTPTAAAKRVVPDVAEELRHLNTARARMRATLRARLEREAAGVAGLRARPVLARPQTLIAAHLEQVTALRERSRRTIAHHLDSARHHLLGLQTTLRALSPGATLDRGYAVLRDEEGHVIRAASATRPGMRLHARVADGTFDVDVAPTPTETP